VIEKLKLQPLSRQALLALLLAMFAISVGYGIVLPILPFVVEKLASPTDAATVSWHTGLITGTYILAIFLFAPLWGRLSDRWGRRPVLLVGLIGFAASLALFAVVENLPLLYLGRFLAGLFGAAIAPAAYALVGDHARKKEWRAHRFALITIAGTIGFFAGPLIGALVLASFREPFADLAERAYSAPFLAASGLALIAALTIWGLVPRAAQSQQVEYAAAETPSHRTVMLRLWAIAFVAALAVGAFEVGLSLRGKQVLGMDAYRIGMMFAECSLVMFVVQALVFSPLIKPEWTRWFITPSLVVLALSLFVVPFADTNVSMIVAVALVAASAGILAPIVTYWVSLGAGDTQGADLGLTIAAVSLGQALGSAAGGLLFDVSILPGATFTATAVVVLTGLGASLGLPQRLQHAQASRTDIAFGESARASRLHPTLNR